MTYSANDLQQIEKFASIYLKISNIAVILDIPADVLRSDIADRSTEVSKAYRRGKAALKVKLHYRESQQERKHLRDRPYYQAVQEFQLRRRTR